MKKAIIFAILFLPALCLAEEKRQSSLTFFGQANWAFLNYRYSGIVLPEESNRQDFMGFVLWENPITPSLDVLFRMGIGHASNKFDGFDAPLDGLSLDGGQYNLGIGLRVYLGR